MSSDNKNAQFLATFNEKEKRKREHEERVRIAQKDKEAKRQKLMEEEDKRKKEMEQRQLEKRLKIEEFNRQQSEARAKKEQLAAQKRKEQEDLARKAREDREAKKEARIEANQRGIKQQRMEKREKEVREAVIKIPPECLTEAMRNAFSEFGEIEMVKVDKFADSFIIRFSSVEARMRATEQSTRSVDGGSLSVSVSKQLVKAHCCFISELISEENKKIFPEYAEKVREMMETVGPVEAIEIVKGHVAVMFKDMETAERAASPDTVFMMNGTRHKVTVGLPKRVKSE
eukprot:TRINITY_DN14167_c1_g1_i1.p1 TRINITY_DN14167_c1_g1~~TRINITY_DN14167_c1_g1_i1.p1  ORF type:complete len:337 (+),score=105.93 TRINITY_DN14167_c1_g1_i1:151-1011(+)